MVFLQLKKIRSLVLAGALEYDNFVSLLRLQEGAFKLSVSENSLLVEVEITNIKHLMTGPEGNSEFTVPQGTSH